MLEDIDSASELRESIRAVTEGNLDEQLGSINIGSYSLTHYDRLSILSSFSSGRSLSTLITGSGLGLTAGALLAPPIGIAIGLGLGGFYAYQAFRVKGRSLFQTEFKEWMTEQCNQTQVTVTTTFQREIIDLQEEMREVVRGALVERERQIATSLKESKQLLDAEESKRAAGKQELQGRSNTVRGIQKEISTLLGSLSATASAPAPAAQPGRRPSRSRAAASRGRRPSPSRLPRRPSRSRRPNRSAPALGSRRPSRSRPSSPSRVRRSADRSGSSWDRTTVRSLGL